MHLTSVDIAAAAGIGSIILYLLPSLIRTFETGLKSGAEWLLGWFFVRHKLDSYLAVCATMLQLQDSRNIGSSSRTYYYGGAHVKPLNRVRKIWFWYKHSHWRLYFYRGALVLFLPKGSTDATVWYLRGTVNWDRFLKESEEKGDREFKIVQGKRFRVTRHTGNAGGQMAALAAAVAAPKDGKAPEASGAAIDTEAAGLVNYVCWNRDDIGVNMEGSTLDDLSLSPSLQAVVNDVRYWHEEEQWFRDHGVPWRLGCLFYGKPGTGKTSLIRALCEDLDLPVHVFDLSNMDNRDFLTAWQSTRDPSGSRAVVLEDFDTVFHGRKPVKDGCQLTFEAILNAIDGVEREDGLLLFVTTNHREHIDPAMGVPDPTADDPTRSTRPGRLDLSVEFQGLDEDGRRKLGRRILDSSPDLERLVREGATDTAAQFQDRCVRHVRRAKWESRGRRAA